MPGGKPQATSAQARSGVNCYQNSIKTSGPGARSIAFVQGRRDRVDRAEAVGLRVAYHRAGFDPDAQGRIRADRQPPPPTPGSTRTRSGGSPVAPAPERAAQFNPDAQGRIGSEPARVDFPRPAV